MSAAVYEMVNFENDFNLTRHAWEQMCRRGISTTIIRNVIDYGRTVHVRGAKIYAIGRKEVRRYFHKGIDLAASEGVQVVCSDDGVIVTTYRNHDFRGLRGK